MPLDDSPLANVANTSVNRDDPEMREYRVVQTTTWYVMADSPDDAEDRISDGMGDLAGTTYRTTGVRSPHD